jgi:hypothetical protein
MLKSIPTKSNANEESEIKKKKENWRSMKKKCEQLGA